MSANEVITLSLVSHTNAGKTTLTRTLLRKDVGEVRDAPHVTLFNEEHLLIKVDDAQLVLWDTPGFGDSARLLKRLRREGNAVLWFISQTWDRMTDRPLWCSQQALKNVRDAADVVLYLVNASEPPGSAAYLAAEMEIISWVRKPVLALLNQTGEPRSLADEVREVETWREELKRWDCVRDVLTLDAFTQCWVQEDRLLASIDQVLPEEKRSPFRALRGAWTAQHAEVFRQSMEAIADMLTASVTDGAEMRVETLLERVGIGRGGLLREFSAARQMMATQLAERMEQTTNRLITLHQLSGSASRQVVTVSREHFQTPVQVHESIWTAIGGAATGAAAGLLADLKAGGFTFGGGALLGTLGGGLGAYALARATNLVRGGDARVHWSREHFMDQVHLAMLCYLAVAHFGRGRGAWDTEAKVPQVWEDAAKAVVEQQRPAWEHVWKLAVERNADVQDVRATVLPLATDLGQRVLRRLYPRIKPE
jgi:predicted GTPase